MCNKKFRDICGKNLIAYKNLESTKYIKQVGCFMYAMLFKHPTFDYFDSIINGKKAVGCYLIDLLTMINYKVYFMDKKML